MSWRVSNVNRQFHGLILNRRVCIGGWVTKCNTDKAVLTREVSDKNPSNGIDGISSSLRMYIIVTLLERHAVINQYDRLFNSFITLRKHRATDPLWSDSTNHRCSPSQNILGHTNTATFLRWVTQHNEMTHLWLSLMTQAAFMNNAREIVTENSHHLLNDVR